MASYPNSSTKAAGAASYSNSLRLLPLAEHNAVFVFIYRPLSESLYRRISLTYRAMCTLPCINSAPVCFVLAGKDGVKGCSRVYAVKLERSTISQRGNSPGVLYPGLH